MRRILALVIVLLSFTAPVHAQQWDQVNGSMQVKSGPTAPLVIIDQTNTGQKILSLRTNGTERCYINTTGDFSCVGTVVLGGVLTITSTAVTSTVPFVLGTTQLSEESAAVLQLGVDAAGVTNQMFKGPDRITSDGVGGNLTLAGGRNRGASAGGSIIFQTAPAAGAGVTGTLATALTIDSTKLATFAGGLYVPTGASTFDPGVTFNGQMSLNANLVMIANNTYDIAATGSRVRTGYFGTSVVTPLITLGAAVAISSTAPTATGTGMAFTVGTGSTSFDWSITVDTANAQSVFTLTLPTAANAWTCVAQNFSLPGTMKLAMSARTTTTAAITQYAQATGLAAVYVDTNVIVGQCQAH